MSSENLDEPPHADSDSSSQAGVDTSPSGDVVPPPSAIGGPVVVRIVALIMVLSSLLSWVDWFDDGFPHITGIGMTTAGTGLAVCSRVVAATPELADRDNPGQGAGGPSASPWSSSLLFDRVPDTSALELGSH